MEAEKSVSPIVKVLVEFYDNENSKTNSKGRLLLRKEIGPDNKVTLKAVKENELNFIEKLDKFFHRDEYKLRTVLETLGDIAKYEPDTFKQILGSQKARDGMLYLYGKKAISHNKSLYNSIFDRIVNELPTNVDDHINAEFDLLEDSIAKSTTSEDISKCKQTITLIFKEVNLLPVNRRQAFIVRNGRMQAEVLKKEEELKGSHQNDIDLNKLKNLAESAPGDSKVQIKDEYLTIFRDLDILLSTTKYNESHVREIQKIASRIVIFPESREKNELARKLGALLNRIETKNIEAMPPGEAKRSKTYEISIQKINAANTLDDIRNIRIEFQNNADRFDDDQIADLIQKISDKEELIDFALELETELQEEVSPEDAIKEEIEKVIVSIAITQKVDTVVSELKKQLEEIRSKIDVLVFSKETRDKLLKKLQIASERLEGEILDSDRSGMSEVSFEVTGDNVINQKGDGNCLLRSIAVGLWFIPEQQLSEKGKELKSIISQQNPSEYYHLLRTLGSAYIEEHAFGEVSERDDLIRRNILTSIDFELDDIKSKYSNKIEYLIYARNEIENKLSGNQYDDIQTNAFLSDIEILNGKIEKNQKKLSLISNLSVMKDKRLRAEIAQLQLKKDELEIKQTSGQISDTEEEELRSIDRQIDDLRIRDYIEDTKKDTVMCDLPHMIALCEILGVYCDVYVRAGGALKLDDNKGYHPDRSDLTKGVINVEYSVNSHYNYILYV